ncbi:MAG: DUF3800 domain-containing protein [Rhodomicrobium sp.]|nr:DUF3800 domain-containing protein [Rhodomicrobium sp.]
MIKCFYLDESGNSGDAALPGVAFDFGDQQIFALACVGSADAAGLEVELTRLAVKHRIQSAELKSTNLTNKPGVAADIAAFLEAAQLPLFIEVVDKRFFIAAHMINHLIMPAVGDVDFSSEGQWLRNVFAEYLYREAPTAAFATFVAACGSPSNSSVETCFNAALGWLKQTPSQDEVGMGLLHFANDSFNDFGSEAAERDKAFERYLPIPDEGLSGKRIWMLPSLTSLTNIYARINHYRDGAMAGVTLLHDEQLHFEAILHDAKATLERLAATNEAPRVRFADYAVIKGAELEFGQSRDHAGIQAADVLAGFVMRYVRDVLVGKMPADPCASETFHKIVGLGNPRRGLGVNFVMPTQNLLRLGVLPA